MVEFNHFHKSSSIYNNPSGLFISKGTRLSFEINLPVLQNSVLNACLPAAVLDQALFGCSSASCSRTRHPGKRDQALMC